MLNKEMPYAEIGGREGTVAVKEPRPVIGSLDDLDVAIHAVRYQIGELAARLELVTRPAATGTAVESPKKPNSCELDSRINDSSFQLQEIANAVEQLRQRLCI